MFWRVFFAVIHELNDALVRSPARGYLSWRRGSETFRIAEKGNNFGTVFLACLAVNRFNGWAEGRQIGSAHDGNLRLHFSKLALVVVSHEFA